MALGAGLALSGAGIWFWSAHQKTAAPAQPPAVAEPAPANTSVPAAALAPTPASVPPRPVLPAGWTQSTNAALIARLLDNTLPLQDRRQAARDLAAIGSDNAIAALKVALSDGPPYLKAAIGEGLGQSPHPEAWPLLLDLANGADEIAARGALRGLALRGETQATDVLAQFLADSDKPESIRTEAALALGDVNRPEALEALTRAATDSPDESVLGSILEGLGKRPFAETEAFFRGYLETPNLSAENKAAALEALGQAQGEVAPFLLQYAADPDPQARAAAAWALASIDSETDLGPALTDLLKKETDPEVRLRLYQALDTQTGSDPGTLLALAQKETDPAARLAGLQTLARACGSDAPPEVLTYFNQTAVPELKNAALTGENPQDRLTAVMALGQAGTAESRDALQQLAASSPDHRVAEAAQAALHLR